jgi:hypothetical protein
MMKRFPDIYSERDQMAGWNVIQSATLLAEAKERRCASLIVYAALEMRMAIEQLVFLIIAVAKGGIDEATLELCRKKDGLFNVLEEVAPQYSLRCRFSNALALSYPQLPQTAEWDVKRFRKFFTALSELCHSQLVIQSMDAAPERWEQKIAMMEEVYTFLAEGMRKGTGVLAFTGENSHAKDLWQKYSHREMSLDDVQHEWALVKALLDGNT